MKKLDEQFQNISWTILPLSNIQKKECIEIADKHAINFAEWLTKKGNYHIGNWNKTTKELLEIYKNQTEL